MPPLLQAMRPKQWAKNVFVFAGVFFDGKVLILSKLVSSIAAFAIFCLVSSAIYLINDLADIEGDRQHPVKRSRPLASGALSPLTAKIAAAVILGACLPAAFVMNAAFGGIVTAYAGVMVLYSFVLKHIVIIDVMTIAAGFVLRVFGGTTVVSVTRFSPWLYVCTTLGALFIAIGKRRHELLLLSEDASQHRSILEEYSIEFLDHMIAMMTSAILIAYSFYTFSAPNVPANHSMMLTIPFVIYGVFRYLYLIHVKRKGGTPEEIALGDRPFLATLVLWALTSGIIIYANLML